MRRENILCTKREIYFKGICFATWAFSVNQAVLTPWGNHNSGIGAYEESPFSVRDKTLCWQMMGLVFLLYNHITEEAPWTEDCFTQIHIFKGFIL